MQSRRNFLKWAGLGAAGMAFIPRLGTSAEAGLLSLENSPFAFPIL